MQDVPKEHLIAGVDEAGRGPLAGPVIAAAVILNPRQPINGLTDSKQLSEKERERLFHLIRERALACAVGRASVREIDTINILQATFLAMQRAVARLKIAPHLVLVDGNMSPAFPCEARAIIQGDLSQAEISAASIVAKVVRDRLMVRLDSKYPGYGFAGHKGYATARHIEAIQLQGICRIHRKSFRPVSEALK
ncbi:ribonuclease HII [Aquicella lusitana]|uniref:Ribonuclease HII n=1 Tax=Aquicella lusitana TaxID=254246 RepID=A0A370GGP3_9COXI|nr:ribonuclease HII [Aquicella lusitana]RDI42837.1 RNase HII [Aquicella lusitana]VVC73080.1 Ribonuclease HII [Aquicella lusitana]